MVASKRECVTKTLRVHGWQKNLDKKDPLSTYGSDAIYKKKLVKADPVLGEKLHQNLPYIKTEVIWAVLAEMLRTVEDFLSRRSRALLLDARTSIHMAPEVAQIMVRELDYDQTRQEEQVSAYADLARQYVLA